MKYLIAIRLPMLAGMVLITMFQAAYAQDKTTSGWQVGFGAGYTNYFGDVSNYRLKGIKDFYKVYRFADYNKYYIDKPSLSVVVHKNITRTLGLLLQANTLSFSASDRYRNKNGSIDTNALHYSRALNFRTSLQDAGFALTFRTNNGKFLPENAFFYPSFFLGAGISTFTVKGDLYDENNNRYNYRLPGNIEDGTFETNLRDQHSETDGSYRNVKAYADLGLALNFQLGPRFTLAVQSDIKYSASDYLDNVSGKYKATYPTPQEQYAARPGYNIVNPLTLQRGDDNGVNDIYINNRVILSVGLGNGKTKARSKRFVAPAVYSLSVPYTLPNEKTDSTRKINLAYRDSLLAAKDSLLLLTRRNDSLARVIDTSLRQYGPVRQNDSVRHDLQLIHSELTEIRNMLRDQQVKPRYQQLQYQADSLKTLQNKISSQRIISREDNLRMRIYQLQEDSVQHELEKLPANGQYPAREKDSSGSYRSTDVKQQVAALKNNNSMHDNVATAVAAPDTVSAIEIKSYNDEIKQLKQDKRYKSDAAYRKTVDSLNKRLALYNQQASSANRTNTLPGQPAVVRDTVINRPDQKKIDSLQNKLNELEKRINTRSSTDTGAYSQIRNEERASAGKQAVADSAAARRNISQLENRLKASNDSIALLRRQMQRSSDSAGYYSKLASSVVVDTVTTRPAKVKWYKRMFSSRKPAANNKAVVQQQVADKNRIEEQQRYYRQQADSTNQVIATLETRNKVLSTQRADILSGAGGASEVIVPAQPQVVYQNDANRSSYSDYDRNELAALRTEIDRLRSQLNYTPRNNNYVPVISQPPVVTVPAQAVVQQPALQQPVAVQDTSGVHMLRSDLDQLRSQLDSIKNARPAVTTREVITNQKLDPKSFPVVSVYFNSGSVVLAPDQIKKLTPFAQVAVKNPDANVLLKGFTDPTGNPAVNQAIAKKRSAYVKTLLTTRFHISEDRIAYDEPSAAEPGLTKKPNPLDRRVDVEFN